MADIIGSGEENSLYLMQIQYLEEQLERCHLKYDKLEKQNKDLASQYNTLETDKKDATESLKRFVVVKQKTVEELAEQLSSQQQAVQRDREELQLQHSQKMKELQDQINGLKSASRTMVKKFEEQQELEERLKQLMQEQSNIESMKKQLSGQKEEHTAAIDGLMNEQELEREKELVEAQQAVDLCVEKKTSKILWKERALHSERLQQQQFLLNENLVLAKEKDVLQDKERDICFEREQMKKELKKITRESFTYKDNIKELKEKCQKLSADLKAHQVAYKSILAKKEDLCKRLDSVDKDRQQKTAKADQLKAEQQWENSRRRQIKNVIQEAGITLSHILTELEKPSETEWKIIRLLEILESTAPPSDEAPPLTTPLRRAEDQNRRYWNPSPPGNAAVSRHPALSPCAPQLVDPEVEPLQIAEPNPVHSRGDQCCLSHLPISE
ncbi:LOW QUALITY PROTEIN: cilia- and flagella-associated protein 157-like [Etheostoma cragini]|uniref:LOW QUALITY PROTEIN: cilia- and flagella-associated protein 157-like n=1 Tax=Etheostoma cragini TaxID=417921 RepID=UPI00155E0968|nr:LOW QUALITY PROTEIN: cilia- and flagella-associated protein 157-like [Etheostoma cragini]